MSSTPTAADNAASDERIRGLLTMVERLLSERREPEALRAWAEAEAIAPEHPLVLHERGRRLLAGGDPHAARAVFERAVAAAPRQLPLRLSLAAALRALARRDEELAVLEAALAIDPTHLVVLLQKATVLDLLGKPRRAAATYAHALQTLAPDLRLPPAIEAHLQLARARVAENAALLSAALESRIEALRRAHAAPELRRFDRCIDEILGRRRIYNPQPTFMLFPYLANFEFYDRELFPWLAQVEAATDAIRAELLDVLANDAAGVRPYIAHGAGVPLNQWKELNHSRRWGAYFLWNEGERQPLHSARCPRTLAALAGVPQVDVPQHGPTVFFSLLEPHTRIPPHTGVTNARLTVHLPLVVPPGCGFRVGGEVREWQVGSAWIFDDTIEHEAWNDSDAPRAILIFDIWNPQLSALERELARESTVVLGEYYGAETPAGAVK